MTTRKAPVVRTQMLIRKPAAEVFEAFVDPAVTTKFWFTKSSGRMEPDREVRWDWEMYGVSARVCVKAVEPNERILIEWGDPPSSVEWRFASRPDGTTLVGISTWGFSGNEDLFSVQMSGLRLQYPAAVMRRWWPGSSGREPGQPSGRGSPKSGACT